MMESIDKDIVVQILEEKPDLIKKLNDYQWGWGKGDRKKALISPLIDALAEKAGECNIDSNKINDFKTKCYKELNATLYTNEKVIISEVETMKGLIKSQSEK